MSPASRVLFWSASSAVAVTGLVYAAMAYCMEPADPMDVVNHPWQPDVQHWHVLTAPLWVFAFGVLWQGHVMPKQRQQSRPRRRTGIGSLALAVPMVASGYLLQTSVDEWWRGAWIVVHVAASLLWILALVVHVLARRRAA